MDERPYQKWRMYRFVVGRRRLLLSETRFHMAAAELLASLALLVDPDQAVASAAGDSGGSSAPWTIEKLRIDRGQLGLKIAKAPPLTVFRRIILPLLKPGLIAGWIYIVIVSVRELASYVKNRDPRVKLWLGEQEQLSLRQQEAQRAGSDRPQRQPISDALHPARDRRFDRHGGRIACPARAPSRASS